MGLPETAGIAPVVLFAYNRPYHTRRALEALEANALSEKSTLHVFCDGPKTEAMASEQELVLEVRNIVRERKWCGDVFLHERESNLGLAQSIREGVDWIMGEEQRAIILEDDIETSPGFLTYMNEALYAYEDDPRVMHINAYLPSTSYRWTVPETFFARQMSCWGWATWKRSWERARWDAAELLAALDRAPGGRRLFDLDGSAEFSSHLERNLRGDLRTWAVFWAASIHVENGLSLSPGRSLVRNIGADGTGENFRTDRSALYESDPTDWIVVTPKRSRESRRGRTYLRSFYRYGRDSRISRRVRLALGRVKHLIASRST